MEGIKLLRHFDGPGGQKSISLLQAMTAGNACNGGPLFFVRVAQDAPPQYSDVFDYCGGPDPMVGAMPDKILSTSRRIRRTRARGHPGEEHGIRHRDRHARGRSARQEEEAVAIMKTLVLGATGMTGQHAVRMLLERGDARANALGGQERERLRVVQGEARDAASFERAVEGQDAVLSVFGPRSLVNVRPGRLTNGPARGGVKDSLTGEGVKRSSPARTSRRSWSRSRRATNGSGKSPLMGS